MELYTQQIRYIMYIYKYMKEEGRAGTYICGLYVTWMCNYFNMCK